ncbi:pyridoxal phosphate-dependent aminotransferase [[Clostridium] polysaccharolyticum]|jgi:threonine-phosphate decarboxylase|uniref:L-threonine O-3-phosphate decarboxylase n=1 Tax=[Clostridium] polysaccharolyticum TaxID=29364 RepID=A0A1I0B9T5_9FIRM|nr:histidinol-phosphate transaminase [[Clostridium] polysaccharolyticum]SET03536.1 L-threonine O-3-phosphate decarboxylase [[Clostridium] polysaccharolyticum]
MKRFEHGGRIYDKKISLDFSSNVNPYGMPQGVKDAIIHGINQYHLYPDDDVAKLKKALAAAEGIQEEMLIFGNGASDLIYRLCQSIRPEKSIVLAPTFSEYEKALRSSGSEVEYLELKKENQFAFSYDLMGKLTEEYDMFFLCNPNNPVGNIIEPETLEAIIETCFKNQIFLVLDECFLDFLKEEAVYSGKQFLQKQQYGEGIFLLKAFTKLYGMAGMRLGYGICRNWKVLEQMEWAGPAWNVSAPAQVAGLAALKETVYVKKTRETIEIERKYLEGQLRKLGFTVYPSKVNYLLFQAPAGLETYCLEKEILIRSCENYIGLTSQHYRIAVRLREENNVLIKCFQEFCKEG